MPITIPEDLLNSSSFTGCPPGYILVGNACVNPLTEHIYEVVEASEYDFEYYEHAGELVGKYNFNVYGDPVSPLTYFAQNCKLSKLKTLNVSNPSMNIGEDEGILSMKIIHNDSSVVIDQEVYNSDPSYNSSFYMGEFHLLPGNIANIKRVNLAYDLINSTGETYSEWGNKKATAPISTPSSKEGDSNSFVKWYLGYVRIPNSDRPDDMLVDEDGNQVTPTILNPIYGTDRLDWLTLRETCYRYIQVYDQSNLLELFKDNMPRNGHYLIQFKCLIDTEKLQEFINNSVDSSGYESPQDFHIIFYPPSFYSFPIDAIDDIDTPKLNSVNSFMEEIVFQAPRNYKSDGNVQYMIEFLTAKNSEDILFRTSSYAGHDWSESFQWHHSVDGEVWESLTSALPSFNNNFIEESGTDSEKTKYIKYELSQEAKELLGDRADILFRIKQIDGTLIA